MEYPDSGVGLSSDRTLFAQAVFLDEGQAREDSKFRRASTSQSPEFDTILDLPDPYNTEFIDVKNSSSTAASEHSADQEEQALREKNAERKREREERRDRQGKANHKEWWEVAGDWIGGAVDVATQGDLRVSCFRGLENRPRIPCGGPGISPPVMQFR